VAGGGTPQLVVELTERAVAAQPAWARTPADDRARLPREAARLLEANAAEVSEWIIRETGGVPAKAGDKIAMTQPIGVPFRPNPSWQPCRSGGRESS
jgi:benzaldehyde dehydrogenase (NAD)